MNEGTSFNALREVKDNKDRLARVKGTQRSHTMAHVFADVVAIVAISVLSLIFAQTVSNVFQDSTLRIIGAAGAIVVGISTIVFLLFNDRLLRSDEQFYVAIGFVVAELALLSLGSLNAFGVALGWQFAPFMVEIMHIAVIVTLPVVAVEWIVVVGILNPDAKEHRAENFALAKRLSDERTIRDNYRNSDEVMRIRQSAVKAEVIEEEMARLPTNMRSTYSSLLRDQGIVNDKSELPDVIDMPKLQPTMATMAFDGDNHPPKG